MVDPRRHPVNTNFDAAAKKSAIPILLHGDEGQGKKERNTLILNWHVLGLRARSVLFRKFPIAAPLVQCMQSLCKLLS